MSEIDALWSAVIHSEGTERIDAMKELANGLWRQGAHDESLSVMQSTDEALVEDCSTIEWLDHLWLMAYRYAEIDDRETSNTLADQGLLKAGELASDRQIGILHLIKARNLAAGEDNGFATIEFRLAIRALRDAEANHMWAMAREEFGDHLAICGDWASAAKEYEVLVRHFEQEENISETAKAKVLLGEAQVVLGRYEAALVQLREAKALAEFVQESSRVQLAVHQLGLAYSFLGLNAEAEKAFQQAMNMKADPAQQLQAAKATRDYAFHLMRNDESEAGLELHESIVPVLRVLGID